MSLVKSGQIANCCAPNALMTLKEYLEDYASEDTRKKGLKLIEKETEHIPNPKIREIAIRNLKAIAEGKIDGLGVARQFLTDPAWVTKLMNDDIASIHPCICCHNACFNMASYKGDDGQLVGNDQTLADNAGMARCALNPQTMQSKKYKIVKAAHPKNCLLYTSDAADD